MQTLAAAAVAADRGDGQLVLPGSESQREARVLEAADLERVTVQAGFGDGVGNEIQVGRSGCPRGELQGHRRAELLVRLGHRASGEVDLDRVGLALDQRCTILGFGARQVVRKHVVDLRTPSRARCSDVSWGFGPAKSNLI